MKRDSTISARAGALARASAGASRFIFRPYLPSDEGDVLELHRRVFGAGTTMAERLTAEHWRWKYTPNKDAGASLLAIEKASGAVVGFVGGVRVALWHGTLVDVQAVHTLDHMVDPAYRRGLLKTGMFSLMINRWVETYFGRDKSRLGFGFPCRANLRIGSHAAQYQKLMDVTCLVQEGLGQSPKPCPSSVGALRKTVPHDADELWGRCRHAYPMMVARTADFLRWRYEQHPEVSYTFAEVRRHGRLDGLAVLRSGGVADDAVTLMDWLTPPDGELAAPALLAVCQRFLRRVQQSVLVGWLPESSPHHGELCSLGFRPRLGPWVVAARVWDERLTIEALQDTLILTLGDMDFL